MRSATNRPDDFSTVCATTRRNFLSAGIAASLAATGLLGGRGAPAQTSPEITLFTYRAPQSALDDLRRRLAQTQGDPADALTRDQMLDNITLYWLTDTAASSARIYAEHAGIGESRNAGVVDLPVGVSMFPREIFPAPRNWAEQFFPKLIYWNEPERGGHFAAFEEPMLFAQEMRAFARKLR